MDDDLKGTLNAIKVNLYLIFLALCSLIGVIGAIGYKLVGS